MSTNVVDDDDPYVFQSWSYSMFTHNSCTQHIVVFGCNCNYFVATMSTNVVDDDDPHVFQSWSHSMCCSFDF